MPRLIHRFLAPMFLAVSILAGGAAETGRPNIVFLLADDMRGDAAGFAGNEIIRTPHLDRLAREGVVFDNGFVTTAICAVSRASILSGQYARRHGIYDFGTRFREEAWGETYPALFREAGYRVGFIGKFGVGNQAPTNTFDHWDGFNGQGRYWQAGHTNHLTRRMGESALRFLRDRDARPFCLSISFKAPHAQDGDREREFPPDPVDEKLYSEMEMPAAPTVSPEAFEQLPEFLRRSEARARWEYRFATDAMRQATVRDYYRLITGMDREIGRIREELERLGLAENTIIVFSSDNGFYLGEHGLAGKWFMHEESIRVPLVIHDPREVGDGEARGVKVTALALNIDIAPTLLHFAGITVPKRMQGRSLRPWVKGRKPEAWREDFFYEHHFPYGGRIPDSEGLRNERWKYVVYPGVEPKVEQLFDLELDPLEQEDLAGDESHGELMARMRQRVQELRNTLE